MVHLHVAGKQNAEDNPRRKRGENLIAATANFPSSRHPRGAVKFHDEVHLPDHPQWHGAVRNQNGGQARRNALFCGDLASQQTRGEPDHRHTKDHN